MQNNKLTVSGAKMGNNTVFPSERSAVGSNAGQATGKQTLYTPNEEALHMHIYSSPQLAVGEEGDGRSLRRRRHRISALTRGTAGGAA